VWDLRIFRRLRIRKDNGAALDDNKVPRGNKERRVYIYTPQVTVGKHDQIILPQPFPTISRGGKEGKRAERIKWSHLGAGLKSQ